MWSNVRQWFIDRQNRKAVREKLPFKIAPRWAINQHNQPRYEYYARRARVNMALHVLLYLTEELEEPPIHNTHMAIFKWLSDHLTLPPALLYEFMSLGKSDSIFFEVVNLAVRLDNLDIERIEKKLKGHPQSRMWESLRTNKPLSF